MTRHYSALSLFKEGVAGQTGWEKAWRSPEPKPRYDAVIVGGGGHGLATAYYLAKNHGVTNVAVLEKGWIGGGNTGRNTTVVRSNYFYPESAAIYGLAHSLYKRLSKDLNYNVMFSARGILTLAHSEAGMETAARSVNAIQVNGIDCELFSVEDVRRVVPIYNFGPDARYPVYGGTWQPSGGTARHDAVAWGYARAASRLGVDIIQNCEISDFIIENGRCRGVVTSRGAIRAERTGMAVAGHSSVLAAKAGFRLPVNSYALQACVSEPVKPIIDTVVISPDTGVYVSQSDKGELVIGGALDRIPSYGQRGNLPVLEGVIAGMLEMFPIFGQLKMMRQWAGIVDVVPDSSPIIGESPLPGLFLNCGWGTGGF
ncbi:sarcosine oxidase subunit beta family protein, partial [Mesorhizobium sp.]